MQPNAFPIASVIDAASKNAQLQEQAREAGNQSLIAGLKSIGDIGQSLYDTKHRIAQSLAIGQQIGIPENLSRTMTPEQLLELDKNSRWVNRNLASTIDPTQVIGLRDAMLGKSPPIVPGNSPSGAPSGTMPAQDTAPAPKSNGAMLTSDVTRTPMPDAAPNGPLPPAATGQMNVPPQATAPQSSIPVPVQAPPLKRPMMNTATFNAAAKLANIYKANQPVPVMTNEEGLAQKSVPKGTIFKEPVAANLNVGLKEDQFYQREWDKLLKESDPLNASSRTPLGLASRATFQANRAIKTLSNPVVTNQEAGNAMADIAAIYQNGSPTQFGMSHQEYTTLYGKAQGLLQAISGKPQDALPDAIKTRLLGVLGDMKDTNSALLRQRLDMTEHSKKAVISRFPDEWKEYRQILEGDQDKYNGMGSMPTPIPAGSTWDQSKEQRYQELLQKRQKGSVSL